MHPEALPLIISAAYDSLTARLESLNKTESSNDKPYWTKQNPNVKHFLEMGFKAFHSYDLGQSGKINDALVKLSRKKYLDEWRNLPVLQQEYNVRRLFLNLADAILVLDLREQIHFYLNLLWITIITMTKTSKGLCKDTAEAVAKDDVRHPVFFAFNGAAMALNKRSSVKAPDYLEDRYKLLKQQIIKAGPGRDYGHAASLFFHCFTYAITGKGTANMSLLSSREQRLIFPRAWD